MNLLQVRVNGKLNQSINYSINIYMYYFDVHNFRCVYVMENLRTQSTMLDETGRSPRSFASDKSVVCLSKASS